MLGISMKKMQDRGELIQVGNRTVDVSELIEWATLEWGEPMSVVADRYRQAELFDALDNAGFPAFLLCYVDRVTRMGEMI